MHEEYHIGSDTVHYDWNNLMESVHQLLDDGTELVAVKRYVNGEYISTFYFNNSLNKKDNQ